MEAQDKAEMRQMMEDLIEPLNVSLKNIDGHLKNLNGSVARHEKAINENLPRTIANCPQREKIEEMHDNMITQKALKTASRNNLLAGASVMGAVWAVWQMIKAWSTI